MGSWENWKNMDLYVSETREKYPGLPIWEEIREKPITVESIDEKIKGGLVVITRPMYFHGSVSFSGEILLREGLDPFKRDITLFHELAHLHHPILLSWDSPNYLGIEKETITEWLGRKARADPLLLRKAIYGFGLEPHIYDKSSYFAFSKQFLFPFAENDLLWFPQMD